MTTTFETAKVGDKVWCILSGWGEVRGIDSSKAYPIAVYFTRDEFKTYTVDGLYLDGDLNQTLFWDEVVIDAPLKPRMDSALPLDEKQASALVPAEPTSAMCEAGANVPIKNNQSEEEWIGDIYRAMIATYRQQGVQNEHS